MHIATLVCGFSFSFIANITTRGSFKFEQIWSHCDFLNTFSDSPTGARLRAQLLELLLQQCSSTTIPRKSSISSLQALGNSFDSEVVEIVVVAGWLAVVAVCVVVVCGGGVVADEGGELIGSWSFNSWNGFAVETLTLIHGFEYKYACVKFFWSLRCCNVA